MTGLIQTAPLPCQHTRTSRTVGVGYLNADCKRTGQRVQGEGHRHAYIAKNPKYCVCVCP
jgi:hypothetical protein